MSTSIPLSVREQAAAWLIALQEQPRNADLHERWRHWLEADAVHRQAWQIIEAFSARIQELSPPLAHATLAAPDSPQRRHAIRVLAVVLFAGGTLAVAEPQRVWQQAVADFYTGTGERTGVDLADGSRVELNAGTALDVRYQASQRTLVLSFGEILVTAAAGYPMPLVVELDEGSVCTVGGCIGVRREEAASSGSHISVYQGSAELLARDGSRHRLEAGQACRLGATGAGAIRLTDENATAWTQGMIVAHEMPLPEFIAELRRHRRGYLGCDPALASVLVTGTFPLEETDRVLDMLQATLPVTLQSRTRFWVRLLPKAIT